MAVLRTRNVLSRYVFPIGVLATFVLAYLLDRWLFTQTRLARSGQFSSAIQNPLFVWTVVSGLVLLAAWLALSWIAVTRSHNSTLVSIIVLVLGVLLYLYSYLEFFFPWLPMLFNSVRTPLAYTGLFVAILGILQVLLKFGGPTVR